MATAQRKIVKVSSRAIKGAALCITAFAACQAHAAPKSIGACTTITKPGSYALSDDIVYAGPTNGACIDIVASKVSINLDGHTISWPGPSPVGFGPSAIKSENNTENVTVRNGAISGFADGIKLLGTGSVVKDVNVGGPCPCEGWGIWADGMIKDNTVSVQSSRNLGVGGITGAGVIKGNYVHDTRSYGIEVAAHSTVIGNTVNDTVGSPGVGIDVTCPSTVAYNTITGSGIANIITNGDGCTIKDNTAP